MDAVLTLLPHDLLWGLPVHALPCDAPGWVFEAVRREHPVVVRRAAVAPGQVAVGVRGPRREQRYATLMAQADICRRVQPEQLANTLSQTRQDWPALQALAQLRPLLNALGLPWGVTGSAGFELASAVVALHSGSDLDLLLRTAQPISRQWAAQLQAQLDCAVCGVDLQLQTPLGAVALREWAGASRQVLLKGQRGAQLVSNPWHAAQAVA